MSNAIKESIVRKPITCEKYDIWKDGVFNYEEAPNSYNFLLGSADQGNSIAKAVIEENIHIAN